MAYETTEVAVSKSQEQIRKLIYSHRGTGLILISQPPAEGFEAMVEIEKLSYHVRIMATCRTISKQNKNRRERSQGTMDSLIDQENRRVWRVLYWHLKAMFEAADSGVVDIRNVIMPYVVLKDGKTLSEHIRPRMAELMTMDSSRLLPTGTA